MFGYKPIVSLLVLLAAFGSSYGQPLTLRLVQTCDYEPVIEDTLVTLNDEEPMLDLAKKQIDKYIAMDRLEAGIDSIAYDSLSSNYTAYLHLGPIYSFDEISLDSLSSELLDRVGIKNPRTTNEFLTARNELGKYYADNGYPFAVVRLDDLQLDEGVVNGYLDIEEGKQVILDSIIVNGAVQIRQGYLRNYLEFHKGEPYNHTNIEQVRRKLDRLRFLKTTKEPNLSFIYDYASLNLFVEPKNTSRFDLLFGVIPTNNITGKQLFLSLDFTTELLNKLGYGEYIFLNFERLRPEQQRLDIKFNYPYILDSPFAIDLSFEIFRNELAYQTVESDVGIQYLLNSTDYIKVGWNYESSKIVEVDTLTILTSQELPDDLSVTQTGLSVNAYFSRLDYRYNPRRGYSLEFGAVGGQRKILIDPTITGLSNSEVDFLEEYEKLDLVSPKYELTTSLSYFQPIARRGTIALLMKGGYKFTTGPLRRNEKFQLGGNKLLRGFDEASLFTDYYGVGTIEYRLLLSENSYFSAPFIDIGYVEGVETGEGGQLAIGLGVGMVAETKVGLFNFSVAVGKNENQSFDFGRPKAHFGFVSLF